MRPCRPRLVRGREVLPQPRGSGVDEGREVGGCERTRCMSFLSMHRRYRQLPGKVNFELTPSGSSGDTHGRWTCLACRLDLGLGEKKKAYRHRLAQHPDQKCHIFQQPPLAVLQKLEADKRRKRQRNRANKKAATKTKVGGEPPIGPRSPLCVRA